MSIFMLMRSRLLISLFLSVVFVVRPVAIMAMETDQFNLPPVPLADIGDEVSEYVADKLRAAIVKLNGEIAQHQACLDAAGTRKSNCANAGIEREKLSYLRSNEAVAKELYKLLGDGNIFVSRIGQWMNSHKFRASPSHYKTSYRESIYVAAPIDYATLSPTVKLFGVEFGTDKMDHFFQQGYKYYTTYNKAKDHNLTDEQATAKAIRWGQVTERTYFGLLVSGVYSNADLYANYAGMKFYQGLTEPISIGDKTRPSPVRLKYGVWKVDDAALRDTFLKPILTSHLNEALNPSAYSFTIFRSVRRAVKKYACPAWKQAYPDLTASGLANRSKELELWNGEDYGYQRRNRTAGIAELCFQNGTNERQK